MSERIIKGRKPNPSMIIVDSKSVKNTSLPAERGYDGAKKVKGIKIHIGVDINGLPITIHLTTANVTDRSGALEMIEINSDSLAPNCVKVLCDGGYQGESFAKAVDILINAEVEVVKRPEMHKFVVVPKRWVVERSFGWLESAHRLWKNTERNMHTTLQMVTLSFISMLLRRY
jgi:transposase